MAASPPFSFYLFAATLSLLLITSHSRSFSPPETTTLDVVSLLQQTQRILTIGTSQNRELPKPIRSNSSSSTHFSLVLHSLDTLTQHKDYESLISDRLGRDSVRVAELNTKLRLALDGPDSADTRIRQQGLTTPVISGTSRGSGQYFSRIGVGTPARELYVVIDTGSDVNWIQSRPCSNCYQQTDPIFDPSTSSSYSPFSCGAQQCQALQESSCKAKKCIYKVEYGDGSFTEGEFATETLSFGGTGKLDGVALGLGHDNQGQFRGAAGLLGLGIGPTSLTAQVKASSFSYCLVNRDSGGSSILEFNRAQSSDATITAPLLKNEQIATFYYVGLTGFSVGGRPVAIPPSLFDIDKTGAGGVIIDSGTTITRLTTRAYNSLRDSFARLTTQLKRTKGVSIFDTCYDFSSETSVRVPKVSLQFTGGKTLELPTKNYFVPVDSAGTFCFAFAPTSSSPSILGNIQQQGTRVSFDLVNKLVGFSPNKC